jgi:E3 ubiquitin-protein ligase MARCH6
VASETVFDKFPTYLGPTEPYFALLGKEVRLAVVKFKDAWYRMAVGSGPAERLFAIGLGYTVVGFVLAMYLNILTVGNARTATRAVRNAVRQQLLVIKVCFVFYSVRRGVWLLLTLAHAIRLQRLSLLSSCCSRWGVALF